MALFQICGFADGGELARPPQTAMALAAAADEALPRSFSSLDEALLQRMVAARLSPQMLSLLMADAERASFDSISHLT